MEREPALRIRAARQSDADAVDVLLCATYPALLPASYDFALLERALPLMVDANAAVFRYGTWYVVESPGSRGRWSAAAAGDSPG